ncbi:hypothetical protein HDV06_000591 [Boothiomyces sp. JEL0866]|nr:hypothetical protein HDV06_000591 [Boothiomyces sp. JEL0866]
MTVELLSALRNRLVYLPYSTQEKTELALSILNGMKVHVNRESKIKNYSHEYPDIDPIPRAQQLYEEAHLLSDHEFHSKALDFTTYNRPGTFCNTVITTALTFEFIESDDLIQNPRVVVSGLSNYKKVLDLSQVDGISIGDELLAANGLSFKQFYETNKWKTGGANEYGGMRRALSYLSERKLGRTPVPETDGVDYTLKKPNGMIYNVLLPWCARYDPKDFETCNQIFQELGLPLLHYISEPDETTSVPEEAAAGFKLSNTLVNQIKWGIYKPETVNMGVIAIEDFTFRGDLGRNLIIKLLQTELKETNCLLIDLRNNGGGNGYISGILVKLLRGGHVKVHQCRIVANEISQTFLASEYPNADWRSGDLCSPIDMMGQPDEGQEYFKPAGVFTTAACYSACESICSTLQNNEAAIVFGEDGQTGGGAARKLDDRYLSKSKYFTSMPFSAKYPSVSGRFFIGMHQTVRNGKYSGQTWEDDGIKSDYIFRPRKDDIIRGDKYARYDDIAKVLNQVAVEKNLLDVAFSTVPAGLLTTEVGKDIYYEIELSGISKLLIKRGNKEIHSYEINPVQVRKKLKVTIKEHHIKVGYYNYNFIGFNSKGEKVIDSAREVRFIPKTSGLVSIDSFFVENQNISVDSPLAQWKGTGSSWTVGPGFFNHTETSLVLIANPVETVSLKLKYTLNCEALFKISVIDQQGTKDLKFLDEAIDTKDEFQFNPIGKWELRIGLICWENNESGFIQIHNICIE